MISILLSCKDYSKQIGKVFGRLINRRTYGKFWCLIVMLGLLSAPGFDVALQQTPVVAFSLVTTTYNVTAGSLGFISRLKKLLFGVKGAKGQRDRLVDRVGSITRLRVTPLKYVGYQGEMIIFSATAMDF